MNVLFGNESFDARHLVIKAGSIKEGDILSIEGTLLKVETVQRGCPSIENLSHLFTSWVLNTATGDKVFTRSIFGDVEVFRPNRKVA